MTVDRWAYYFCTSEDDFELVEACPHADLSSHPPGPRDRNLLTSDKSWQNKPLAGMAASWQCVNVHDATSESIYFECVSESFSLNESNEQHDGPEPNNDWHIIEPKELSPPATTLKMAEEQSHSSSQHSPMLDTIVMGTMSCEDAIPSSDDIDIEPHFSLYCINLPLTKNEGRADTNRSQLCESGPIYGTDEDDCEYYVIDPTPYDDDIIEKFLNEEIENLEEDNGDYDEDIYQEHDNNEDYDENGSCEKYNDEDHENHQDYVPEDTNEDINDDYEDDLEDVEEEEDYELHVSQCKALTKLKNDMLSLLHALVEPISYFRIAEIYEEAFGLPIGQGIANYSQYVIVPLLQRLVKLVHDCENEDFLITLRYEYGSSEFKECEELVCNTMSKHPILHEMLNNTELPERWEAARRRYIQTKLGNVGNARMVVASPCNF